MFEWVRQRFGTNNTPFTRDSFDSYPADPNWSNYDPDFSPLIKAIESEMRNHQVGAQDLKWTDSETFQSLKSQSDEERATLCDWLVTEICERAVEGESVEANDRFHMYFLYDWGRNPVCRTFVGLMRSKQNLPVDMILRWVDTIIELNNRRESVSLMRPSYWPLSHMVQQIEHRAKTHPLTETQIEHLKLIAERPPIGEKAYYYGSDLAKVKTRIEKLIGGTGGADVAARPYKKLSGDNFGNPLEAELEALSPEQQEIWNTLFNHAASANGAKPPKVFQDQTGKLAEKYGKENLRKLLQDWLQRAASTKIESQDRHDRFGRIYKSTGQRLFTSNNATLVKGLVWMCAGFRDAATIRLIADLCEKCMKKIPGQGPAAQATANACLWFLEITPGAEATARLSRLGTAVKQKSIQKRVKEIVAKKAEEAGITTIQLEERVVPDFGLEAGSKTVAFGDYALRIDIKGPGKIAQTWIKPDGSPQKTKPAIVGQKADLKKRFDKVKSDVVNLKKILTAQRDRIDRLFAEDLTWPLEEVEQYYIGHGLVSTIAGKLIWQIGTGKASTSAFHVDGGWQNVEGKAVKTDDKSTARLWHPVDCPTDEVIAWRERLAEIDVLQPMKQAHREVYLLTDAEKKTNVYSNRMAAHMVKQHQAATLMAARGWRYQLMGAYDDGLDDQFASKTFVTSHLRVEYLIRTIFDNDELWNDAGIYLYVGTDQLRFVQGDDDPVALETVPPRLISETMREADLFVGVASVGNDPAWFDQGPTPESRNYWQSYSFGNLDQFAETRRAVLEALLPRLKICNAAHIEGKFLIVDGKLNTYKIHLGSSNILMEPGDRYLCIVPGSVKKASKDIALPFEGDSRLSVILSKALMLADDDKITATDIVSQLKR